MPHSVKEGYNDECCILYKLPWLEKSENETSSRCKLSYNSQQTVTRKIQTYSLLWQFFIIFDVYLYICVLRKKFSVMKQVIFMISRHSWNIRFLVVDSICSLFLNFFLDCFCLTSYWPITFGCFVSCSQIDYLRVTVWLYKCCKSVKKKLEVSIRLR